MRVGNSLLAVISLGVVGVGALAWFAVRTTPRRLPSSASLPTVEAQDLGPSRPGHSSPLFESEEEVQLIAPVDMAVGEERREVQLPTPETAPQSVEAKYAGWSAERLAGAARELEVEFNREMNVIGEALFAAGKFETRELAPEERLRFEGPGLCHRVLQRKVDGRRIAQIAQWHVSDYPKLADLGAEVSWLDARLEQLGVALPQHSHHSPR